MPFWRGKSMFFQAESQLRQASWLPPQARGKFVFPLYKAIAVFKYPSFVAGVPFPKHLLSKPEVSLRFLGWCKVKESASNARDPGLIPGLGRFLGEGNGNLLQYPYLENSIDRGAWWATVHGVLKESRQEWASNTFTFTSFFQSVDKKNLVFSLGKPASKCTRWKP